MKLTKKSTLIICGLFFLMLAYLLATVWLLKPPHLPIKQSVMNDINKKGKHGLTPLHWAAMQGDVKLLKDLLDARADVNARDNLGRTPLMYACGAPPPWESGKE